MDTDMSNPTPTPEALPEAGGSWLRTADGRIVRAEPERAEVSAEVEPRQTIKTAPPAKE
jgi:hypothetical protein